MTKSGGQPNKVCVFPWKYNEEQETYNGCANPDNDAGGLWCPTETDSNGVYTSGSGKWGNCKMEDEGGHCTTTTSLGKG